MFETHIFHSVIRNLHNLEVVVEIPEQDVCFLAALTQRPEDVELQDVYYQAIELGLADGIVPSSPPPETQNFAAPFGLGTCAGPRPDREFTYSNRISHLRDCRRHIRLSDTGIRRSAP